jgi:integrase/recombinase XerC
MGTELATATVHPAELVEATRAPAPTSTDARHVDADRAARLVAEWLVGKAGPTVTAYRADLDAFATYLAAMADDLGARPPADAPEAVAVLLSRSKGEAATITTAYRQWMEAPTDDRPQLAPSTVGRRLAALSSLVATAYRSDLIGWELTLKGPKVESYRDTRGPGADAVADMVEALDPSTAAGARDRAIVLALAGMGLRRGELVALDLDDLDAERGTVMVTGKGRTQAVPLTVPGAVLDAFAAWIDHRGTEAGPMFHGFRGKAGRLNGGSVARIVAKAAKGAEVAATVRPHGLRHTAITEALEVSGGNLREAAKFSRHQRLETILIYDDNRTDVAGQLAAKVTSRFTRAAPPAGAATAGG